VNVSAETPFAPAEDVIRRLESHGVMQTPQRVEIGQVLFARPQHLSAERILETLRGMGSTVSKATVYNTLNLFAQKGLVRIVTVDPTRLYYDSTTSEHHHFYDADTGELIDIPAEEIEVSRLPQLPEGTVAEGVQVVVRVRRQS
jgi:Fur family transcriptional regulator, iron response regulator